MLIGYAHCHQSIIAKNVPSIDYMRFLVYRTERKVLFIAPPAEPSDAMRCDAMRCDAPLARPCYMGLRIASALELRCSESNVNVCATHCSVRALRSVNR